MRLKMFDWFKRLMCMKIQFIDNPFNPAQPKSAQEDPRAMQSVKNTRSAFKKQQAAMDIRVMKAHGSECDDPWTCTKDICFKYSPDKVVSASELSRKEVDRMKSTNKKNKTILRDMRKTPKRKQNS